MPDSKLTGRLLRVGLVKDFTWGPSPTSQTNKLIQHLDIFRFNKWYHWKTAKLIQILSHRNKVNQHEPCIYVGPVGFPVFSLQWCRNICMNLKILPTRTLHSSQLRKKHSAPQKNSDQNLSGWSGAGFLPGLASTPASLTCHPFHCFRCQVPSDRVDPGPSRYPESWQKGPSPFHCDSPGTLENWGHGFPILEKTRGNQLCNLDVINQAWIMFPIKLVGGFNPFEKYESNWKSSPNRGENEKYLKPPARKHWNTTFSPRKILSATNHASAVKVVARQWRDKVLRDSCQKTVQSTLPTCWVLSKDP